ncbi:hypothetical protein [Rhodococcoides kroppenstedtii]|nr:hypothetical protein [Rhodococcus kroppenstedtii]
MTAALAVEGVLAFCVLLTLFAFLAAWALPTLTSCVADVLPAQDRGLGYGALQIGATVGARSVPCWWGPSPRRRIR